MSTTSSDTDEFAGCCGCMLLAVIFLIFLCVCKYLISYLFS